MGKCRQHPINNLPFLAYLIPVIGYCSFHQGTKQGLCLATHFIRKKK